MTLADLQDEVEHATETKIFEHIHLASDAAIREAKARNLPLTVIEGDTIYQVSADGKERKKIGVIERKTRRSLPRKFTLR